MTEELDPTTERIRALMARKDWSQAQISKYLGVRQSSVCNYMAGTRKPGGTIARLLDVLGTVEALAPGLHKTMEPK